MFPDFSSCLKPFFPVSWAGVCWCSSWTGKEEKDKRRQGRNNHTNEHLQCTDNFQRLNPNQELLIKLAISLQFSNIEINLYRWKLLISGHAQGALSTPRKASGARDLGVLLYSVESYLLHHFSCRCSRSSPFCHAQSKSGSSADRSPKHCMCYWFELFMCMGWCTRDRQGFIL